MTGSPTLVGDGIENAWNALTLQHAADMFGWNCRFRDRADLLKDWQAKQIPGSPSSAPWSDIRQQHHPIIAFDNGEGSRPLYGFRPESLDRLALVVGNERRGLARDVVHAAHHLVQVPMVSRRVNCLNVAAAGAVALYYLSKGGGGKLYSRADPHRSRPELLLVGAGDHVELGSTIRSAAAFGWRRAFVEDRAEVWFGGDRMKVSQGRAAARRAKNSIRLVKAPADRRYAFDEACILSLRPGEQPLARTHLARGPRQLVVLVDDQHVDVDREDWSRLARRVRRATIDVPAARADLIYHYRLTSTVALAEVARQVGARPPKARRGRRPPVYDRLLRTLLEDHGETVLLEDLARY
ncbi:MAG: TrmH family RNA methyltransferase [Acidobacteriota bacterium]